MIYAKARMDTLQEAVDRLELVQERYKQVHGLMCRQCRMEEW
jgi:hypothetical protein